MNLLAIETATNICGAALWKDDEFVDIVEDDIPRRHAENLPIYVDQLFRKQQVGVSDLDAIAVSIGPGSFTGLRIGLSYAKGLAFSQGLPLIPVPTLLSLVSEIDDPTHPVTIALFSHATRVFYQEFWWKNGAPHGRDQPRAIEWEELTSHLTEDDRLLHWNCDRLLDMISPTAIVESVVPTARRIGTLAIQHHTDWIIENPQQIVPNYVSPFVSGGK